MTISSIAQVRFSSVDKKQAAGEKPVKLCNYVDVFRNPYITRSIPFMLATASEQEIERFGLQLGDVLLTKDSETAEDIAATAVVSENVSNLVCGYHLALLRPSAQVHGAYLMHALHHESVHRQFVRLANGITRFGLPISAFDEIRLLLPPIDEQIRVANILGLCDRRIRLTEEHIRAKRRRQRTLMRDLLTGARRVPGFAKSKWREVRLGDLLQESLRPVDKPHETYRALGLRSHGKGTFQRTVTDHGKVMMDTLYRVEPGDLIVNITFAWEGAIAIVRPEDAGCLVSHRFPTFTFRTEVAHPRFFAHLIRTHRFVWTLGLISPGGAGRNRVLSKKDFVEMPITLPALDEQAAIAAILDTCECEIGLEEARLEKLNQQKRGLLQTLFEHGESKVDRGG